MSEPNFEQQQAELEQIVERLERGDVGLDELTKLWERGGRCCSKARRERCSTWTTAPTPT